MIEQEESTQSDIAGRTTAWFALVLALLLAGAGEYAARATAYPIAAVPLYLAAIALIAVTSTRFCLPPPVAGAQTLQRVGWLLLATGALASLALAWQTFGILREDTGDPRAFPWWLISLAPLLIASVACWFFERPYPLWKSDLPASRAGMVWTGICIVTILVVAAVARLLWLDAIPFGVNPDEGDRAAVAIQIVRGTTPAGIFEAGWYYISMLYFHLMALAFKWFGIGYVQARTFTALFGILSVAITIWIGARHFSWRVALLAGILAATAGVVLQFSRLTTEAGPTATFWLLSLALMLEGARGGRMLPWTLAGFAGGLSLYFYPTGRVWALLALLWGGYLLVRWIAARRTETVAIARGLAVAAVAALVIATPYLAWVYAHPHELTLRFDQTTVFDPSNAARLDYVDPAWSLPRLVGEQLMRTLGIVNHFEDGGGVWPIHQSILSPLLALLALLGAGIASTRWRDPRATMLGIAFWVGISGVVITVETPNLIRMATAIPLLPLLAALTLEECILRTSAYFTAPAVRRRAGQFATAGALILAIAVGFVETRFYFADYARMNLWQAANQEGRALSLLPPGTRYTSLGTSFHMINSGWVRLIAPKAERAGYKHPGSDLPFVGNGTQDIGVLLYPGQDAHLRWLQTLYPQAQTVDYRLPDEAPYFTLLHLPASALATQGKILLTYAGAQGGEPVLVDAFGDFSGGTPASSPHRWSATWRVPQQWDYHFKLTGASASLLLDGMPFLANSQATPEQVVTVNLARGDHAFALTGIPNEVSLQVARATPGGEPAFAPLPAAQLLASDGTPRGLSATVQTADGYELHRQDNTLATCCIGDLLHNSQRQTRVTWKGLLSLPVDGEYGFRLQTPASGDLLLNDNVLIHLPEQGVQEARIVLDAGSLPIEVALDLPAGANGPLELLWQPPGEEWSILPHLFLTPEYDLLWQPALGDALLQPGVFAVDEPSETIR